MPSDRLIPEHFNKDGLPKLTFTTQELADRAAWLKDMNCYECDFCGYWHLSKKENNETGR